jgi:hypothetical protein
MADIMLAKSTDVGALSACVAAAGCNGDQACVDASTLAAVAACP